MDIYVSADNRASTTLDQMIAPYLHAIGASTSLKDIIQAIVTHLPPGLAYQTELRLRIFIAHQAGDITGRNFKLPPIKSKDTLEREFGDQQIQAMEVGKFLIEQNTCEGLPAIINEQGNQQYFYMREDLIRWFNSSPTIANYLSRPSEEIITIEIRYGDKVKTTSLRLTQDQMIGISYGLNGMNSTAITLRSSITNSRVAVEDIAKHALVYRLPINLATEHLKRPYQVDVLQPDKSFLTVYFVTPEFMQGILSVAQWFQLPNNGKTILWKDLSQFTREGLIPLRF